jgi:membrane protein
MAKSATSEKAESAPHPDDPRKPDSPDDLTGRSWKYVARKALREFGSDQCTDLAAALTYYAVQALFPALLALVSLLGVFGQGQSTVNAMLKIIRGIGPASVATTLQPVLSNIVNSQKAGLALVVGILLALWSASGYVGAFSRAMNRVYEIEEGRPFWKMRPMQLVVTVIAVVLAALALIILVVSGPVATSIGNTIGLGSTALTLWNIIKWPVLVVILIVVIAVLYQMTPNVKRPKWTWTSVGALTAIGVWALASLAFGFYVANFSNYNKTYGTFAGVIVFLLWLWITNLALLFGAELDAELERGRELQAGMPAEETLQLPARDTSGIEKAQDKRDKDITQGRRLRREAGRRKNQERDDS